LHNSLHHRLQCDRTHRSWERNSRLYHLQEKKKCLATFTNGKFIANKSKPQFWHNLMNMLASILIRKWNAWHQSSIV
jgi:hypothetical protein